MKYHWKSMTYIETPLYFVLGTWYLDTNCPNTKYIVPNTGRFVPNHQRSRNIIHSNLTFIISESFTNSKATLVTQRGLNYFPNVYFFIRGYCQLLF
jgi:hypothetical protein